MRILERALILVAVFALCACGALAEAPNSYVLPQSLTVIEPEAFLYCAELRTLIVPEGATRILSRAFSGCPLEEVQLPSSLEYIAEDAFDESGSPVMWVSEGSYAAQWAREHGYNTRCALTNEFYRYVVTDGLCTILACISDLPEAGRLPGTIDDYPVVEVADCAFEGCPLGEVMVPEGVARLGAYAFRGCATLATVTLPSTLAELGSGCFAECPALESVVQVVRYEEEAGPVMSDVLKMFLSGETDAAAFSGNNEKIAAAAEDGTVTVSAGGQTTIDVSLADGRTIAWKVKAVNAEGMLPLEGLIIGIDPGHQLKGNLQYEPVAPDSTSTKYKVTYGCTGAATGISEYVTVLEVGLKFRESLREQGATVYMTRETHDVDISNVERALMMNAYGCDVWFRLHCNSYDAAYVNGIEIHVSKSYAQPEVSNAMAEIVLRHMAEATGARNRGVWVSDKYSGNNWSVGPCLLVEMGYASNYDEDRKLNDPVYQQTLVDAMIAGLREYYGR